MGEKGSGGREKEYFRGWYFKHSLGERTIALIPGISVSGKVRHAFIQVIASWLTESWYVSFPAESFHYQRKPLSIDVGGCRFSLNHTAVNIHYEDHHLRAFFSYGPVTPLETSLFSLGIMGPFSFLPGMECNHEVISLYHSVRGELEMDGERFTFESGQGYIEGNWGRAFPRDWVWVQSNSFIDVQPVSLLAAVARIPYMGREFAGLIAVFLHGGRQYRFATYNGGEVEELSADKGLNLVLRRGKARLSLHAVPSGGRNLMAPHIGGMTRSIRECLDGTVEATLTVGDHTVFSGTGQHASLEMVGEP